MLSPRKHWSALLYLFLVALAAVLRFGWLTRQPEALWIDEAWFSLQGREVWRGATLLPLSEPDEGVGNSLFQIYASALAQAFGAPLAYSSRVASAVLGWLTVVALYPALRLLWADLLPDGQRRIAALASTFVFATLFVGIHSSRGGVQTAGCALWTVITLTASYCAFARRSWRWAAASGLSLAIALTTYEAAYSLPLVVVAYAALRMIRPHRPSPVSVFWLTAGIFGVATVALAPLIAFYLQRPGALLAHLADTQGLSGANWTEALARLTRGLWKTWLGVSVRGDALPGRDLVYRPMFDAILSVLLWGGVIWAMTARRYRLPASQLMFLWIGLTSLPSAVTKDTPAFTRMLIMAPGLCAFAGLGAAAVWQWSAVYALPARCAVAAALVLGLLMSASVSAHAYFVRWLNNPRTFDALYAGARLTADKALAFSRLGDVLLTSRAQPLVRYPFETLLAHTPVAMFDATPHCLPYPDRPPQAVVYGIIPLFDEFSLAALKAAYPSGAEVDWVTHPDGYAYSIFFRVPPDAPAPAPARAVEVEFEKGLRLLGYEAATEAHPGEVVTVKLYWQTGQPITEALTGFVHVGKGEKSDPLVAQQDAPLCPGFDTTRWRPGYTYIETRTLPVAPDAPPDRYDMRVGVYLASANRRLTLLSADVPTENNRALLASFDVH